MLLLLWISPARAQHYPGLVADKEDGKPIAGAIVTATDAAGKSTAYTTTGADGSFTLAVGTQPARIVVSAMGYRKESIPLPRGRIVVLMTSEPTRIREVTIRAPRLTFRGDTVSYNVASFTEAQDRTIADVLRKMPGIEVAPSGEIRYKGEAISNLYIEGLDMLDGRYSLATDNIVPQDVESVEVLENHQPIKALKDIVFSEKAALNLRLRPHARGHWTGSLQGSAGCSPMLWNAGLFAMRIASGGQSMVHLKSDDTGQDPMAETRRLTVDDLLNGSDNRYEVTDYVSVGTASAPLDKARTRFNRSHMAALNNLCKLSDEYQLSTAFTYGYDRTTSDYGVRREWFLPDGVRLDTEQQEARLRQQEATARLSLKANTERFFLQERIEAALGWSDLHAQLRGSYPNRQHASVPDYGVENYLKYILRSGTRSLTATSYMKYLSQPQSLVVQRETGTQRQQVAARAFFMNHNAEFGARTGRFVFRFKGGITALARRFDSSLEGAEPFTDTLNRLSLGYVGAYLNTSVTYRTQRLRLTLDLPAGYRHYWYDRRKGGSSPTEAAIWLPRLFAKWSPSGRFSVTAAGTIGRGAAPDDRMGTGALLQNYRTVVCGIDRFAQRLQRTLSAGASYKNPIGGFFASLLAVRSWNDLPYLATQRFEGDYVVNGYLRRKNRTASWYVSADISRNIDALHGQAGIGISYNSAELETMLEETLTPYRTTSLSVAPRFNFRFARWCNTEYGLTYRLTRLALSDRPASSQHAFNQHLSLNLSIAKKLVLQLAGEHYYARLSSTQSKHLLLADVSARWKIGERWEVSLTAANLFDRKEYLYTLFDGLNSSTYRYAIRPRNLLLGASWRF